MALNKHDFARALGAADRVHMEAQYELDTDLYIKGTIDETALLWDGPEQLQAFVEWAVNVAGMEHFNRVDKDIMRRVDAMTDRGVLDTAQQFMVRFEFLRFPGANWRIEAMCVLDGLAPLHSAALAVWGPGCVVHASFKTSDRMAYKTMKEALGHTEGPFTGIPKAAEYMNSYGLFAYFGAGDRPYLKPRVNLRDI